MQLIRFRLFLLCFVLNITVWSAVVGQQQAQFTQFMLNKYALNPAFAGLEKSLSITAALRTQWTQLPGSPSTQMINAHLPLYFLSGSAGIDVLNDEVGATALSRITVSYNFVQDTPFGLFSAGLKAGFRQVRLRSGELRTPTGNYADQSIDHRDPILASGAVDGLSPAWGLGFYYVGNDIEFGISWEDIGNTTVSGNARLASSDMVAIIASYDIYTAAELKISPTLLVRTDFAQTQTDLGVLASYTKYFGGFTLRGYNSNSLDALNVIAGTQLSAHLRISYSFDLGISSLQNFHDGSHEFMVNYNLNKKIRTGELPRIIYNPRFN